MRSNHEVFDSRLDMIENIIEKKQFMNCYRICNDLTRYSILSDYQDGLLISEVFEGVFSQLDILFDRTNIPEPAQKLILTDLKNNIVEVKNVYKNNDKTSIYEALKKIRNTTTCFQIDCWSKFPNKPTQGRLKMR